MQKEEERVWKIVCCH